jgi:hypothetical protein
VARRRLNDRADIKDPGTYREHVTLNSTAGQWSFFLVFWFGFSPRFGGVAGQRNAGTVIS